MTHTTIKQPTVSKSDPINYPYLCGMLEGMIRGIAYDMPEEKRKEIKKKLDELSMKARAYQKGISLYHAKRR